MKFQNNLNVEVDGTCLQGEMVDVSYAMLVEAFGEPTCDGDEYKVQKEWMLQFEDGTVATIYDWKWSEAYNGRGRGKHYTKVTDWHVGGRNRKAVLRVNEVLAEKFKDRLPKEQFLAIESM